MASLAITDPSFEINDGTWTIGPGATVETDGGYLGDNYARLVSKTSSPPPSDGLIRQEYPSNGLSYRLQFYVRRSGAAGPGASTLTARSNLAGNHIVIPDSDVGTDWVQYTVDFVADTSPTDDLQFETDRNPLFLFFHEWDIDWVILTPGGGGGYATEVDSDTGQAPLRFRRWNTTGISGVLRHEDDLILDSDRVRWDHREWYETETGRRDDRQPRRVERPKRPQRWK